MFTNSIKKDKTIFIPTVMIDNASGQLILKAINGTDVYISAKFPHIPKREKVKVVLWISSNDEKSY